MIDIHAHLAELEDIPGTRVFTAARSRKGYHLNQFCMSLMRADNRARFKADEGAYLDDWPLSPAQRAAVLARDYNAAIDEGGNIYFLAKIFSTDGRSFVQAVSTMTGASVDEHTAMMIAGGRSVAGLRSRAAALAEVAAEAGETSGSVSSPALAAEGDRAASGVVAGAVRPDASLRGAPSTMQEHGPPPPNGAED